jgi:carbon storage regulator
MLVLSRKRNEKLVVRVPGVERPIVLTVVELRGDKVRLGYDADPAVKINREEIDRLLFPNDPPPLSSETPAAA